MKTRGVVCLFVKPPVPGRVKTRLAAEVGGEKACRIYRQLVEGILEQIRASDLPWALFYDGDSPEQLPETWRHGAVRCYPQEGEGLGARLQNAFRQLFFDGYSSVLLCGSDVVGLDARYLLQAAAALEQAGLVIAPAFDGGYCLIGFTAGQFTPRVFEQIDWSTEQVLSQTLAQCGSARLKPMLLNRLRDIDTLADLIRAQKSGLFSAHRG